jgi:hypothetical protein
MPSAPTAQLTSCATQADAAVVAALLEDAGIPCGFAPGSVSGFGAGDSSGWHILVAEADIIRAASVLAEVARTATQEGSHPDRCDRCGYDLCGLEGKALCPECSWKLRRWGLTPSRRRGSRPPSRLQRVIESLFGGWLIIAGAVVTWECTRSNWISGYGALCVPGPENSTPFAHTVAMYGPSPGNHVFLGELLGAPALAAIGLVVMARAWLR